jgi:hypothetical protein
MPKDNIIVATSTNERHLDSHERVYEIETFCWNSTPVINLYAINSKKGLNPEQATPSEGYMDGVRIETSFGEFRYGAEHIKLYSGTRRLASIILDPRAAQAIIGGSSWIALNSYTAAGVNMTGEIDVPRGGDPAIAASFRNCLR